jgi:hypothetical protein
LEKESTQPLPSEVLSQVIADIAGIDPSDVPNSISITQVPWTAPVKDAFFGRERTSLPLRIESDAVDQALSALSDGAIWRAEYDAEAKRIFVARDEEKKAILVLAERGLLAVMSADAAEASKYPLPLKVDPADSGEVLASLADKGIASASYAPESRLILVSGEDDKKAVIALAEERILGEAHRHNSFYDMRARWFGSGAYSEKSTARLLESMDGIEEAVVHCPADSIRTLFGLGPKQIAVVRVKLERNAPLGEDAADAIIAIVAAATPRLDPRDVSVADQFGNKFRSRYGYSYYSLDKRDFEAVDKLRWDAEFAHNEQLRNELERLAQSYIDIQLGGDIDVFSQCELNPGTGESAAKQTFNVKNISVVIHLPYRLKRGGEGRPIQQTNEHGEALFDSETRLPLWERESADRISSDRIDDWMRLFADASGISRNEIPEKIKVYQIPWNTLIPPFEDDNP